MGRKAEHREQAPTLPLGMLRSQPVLQLQPLTSPVCTQNLVQLLPTPVPMPGTHHTCRITHVAVLHKGVCRRASFSLLTLLSGFETELRATLKMASELCP